MVFDCFGDRKKVVISMAHIGALPGSPLYNADGGVQKLIDDVMTDVEKLQDGGVDAIMFGNENDRPYVFKASPESIAAMTAIVQAIKPAIKVPFGVNYLWDPSASVAIGAVTGASFVREIFTGLFASDMGLWQPDCASASRLRSSLRRDDMKLLFNINAEFAAPIAPRPVADLARSVAFSSGVWGSVRGTPATNSAGTGALRHDITRMPRAWASFVERWKFGMTVSWTRARGSLRCATCQANEVFCPESRPYSYCSGALSPTNVRSGPIVPPRPLIT